MSRNVISNKTIWITGGSSGIGRSLALRLASWGNYVVITGRDSTRLEAVAACDPSHISSLVADLSCDEKVPEIASRLAGITDHLDLIILCAGSCEYVNDLELDCALFRRVFDSNFFAAVNSVGIALPLLKCSQQRPHIVGISSLSTVVPFPRAEAYGASKAALEYFLDSARIDVMPLNIDVTVVRPGFVDTPMVADNDFPMPFKLSAPQAVDAILAELNKRKRLLAFPKRFAFILMLGSVMSSLWYRWVAPKLTKSNGL